MPSTGRLFESRLNWRNWEKEPVMINGTSQKPRQWFISENTIWKLWSPNWLLERMRHPKGKLCSVYSWDISWGISEHRPANPPRRPGQDRSRQDLPALGVEEGLLLPNHQPFQPLFSSPGLESSDKTRARLKGENFPIFVLPKYNQRDLKRKWLHPIKSPVRGKLWESDGTKQCLSPKSFIFPFWGCHKCMEYTGENWYAEFKKIRANIIPRLTDDPHILCQATGGCKQPRR